LSYSAAHPSSRQAPTPSSWDAASFCQSLTKSHMAVSVGLNDFLRMEDWDVDAHNKAHGTAMAWLNSEVKRLEQTAAQITMFTHWIPTTDSRTIEPQPAGNSILSAFSADSAGRYISRVEKSSLGTLSHTLRLQLSGGERGTGSETVYKPEGMLLPQSWWI
jgi:hypothetical protein